MKLKFFALILLFALVCNQSFCAVQIKTEKNDYIEIQRETKTLKSRLSETYNGYEYIIKNIYDKPVTIQNISIFDNANSTVAYLSVKKTNKEVVKSAFSKGARYSIPTLTLSLIGVTLSAPFIVISNNLSNSNAQKEAKKYDIETTFPVVLESGEKLTIKTIALKRYYPFMRLLFLNPLTEENMTLEIRK